MWKEIGQILMSPNATIILCFLVFFVLIGAVLSKTGLLNIKTDTLQIGAATRERDILRNQIEWIKLHCEAMESELPKPEGYDQWRGKYITERVYDEYVDWITFNHLSTSSSYVSIKQDRLIALVKKLTVKDIYKSPDFEEYLRNDTRECIEKLVQIRAIYK